MGTVSEGRSAGIRAALRHSQSSPGMRSLGFQWQRRPINIIQHLHVSGGRRGIQAAGPQLHLRARVGSVFVGAGPVGGLVGLAVAQLLLVRLGLLLPLAAAGLLRGAFVRSSSDLLSRFVVSFPSTSSCPTTVRGRKVSQWPNRGDISGTGDFYLPAGTSRGRCWIFGGRQGKRGWGAVKFGMWVVMGVV